MLESGLCCETRLYSAAMVLECLSTRLRRRRLDHALTRERVVDALEELQAAKFEVDAALECAADEVAALDRLHAVLGETEVRL
jgi:hypothetical protein